MDYYKYESVGEHPPTMNYTEDESLTYFTQQAIRAGYVAPQFENKLDHIQQQPANMREALRIEIEKELIREEIIAEEMGRRHMLEFEVRRELVMERQLAQQCRRIYSFLFTCNEFLSHASVLEATD